MLASLGRLILITCFFAVASRLSAAPAPTPDPLFGARVDPLRPRIIILPDLSRVASTPELLEHLARLHPTTHTLSTNHHTTFTLPPILTPAPTPNIHIKPPPLFLDPIYAPAPTPAITRRVWRRAPPPYLADPAGPLVLVTRSGAKYHRPGCPLLRTRNTMRVSLASAIDAGYSACTKCFR